MCVQNDTLTTDVNGDARVSTASKSIVHYASVNTRVIGMEVLSGNSLRCLSCSKAVPSAGRPPFVKHSFTTDAINFTGEREGAGSTIVGGNEMEGRRRSVVNSNRHFKISHRLMVTACTYKYKIVSY